MGKVAKAAQAFHGSNKLGGLQVSFGKSAEVASMRRICFEQVGVVADDFGEGLPDVTFESTGVDGTYGLSCGEAPVNFEI